MATPPVPSASPPPTVKTLVETLRHTGLLDGRVIDDIAATPEAQADDVQRLAKTIYDKGWLTRYQLSQLAIGRSENLVLGQYHLLEKIGEGGFGAVFKALHPMMNRVVALKRIRKERLANANAERRFFREVQAAARLEHPNVVRAYDAGQVGTIAYLVMEYVDGVDLSRLVKTSGPLGVREACEFVRQAALGLQAAHERGLIHRDIKPSNILVTPVVRDGDDGPPQPAPGASAKILDMGLARLDAEDDEAAGTYAPQAARHDFGVTRDNQVVGTPDYLAPEQIERPKHSDIRADLYSLGCTFYYLLAGHVPFPSESLKDLLDKHRYREPTPIDTIRPDVPPGVAEIVHRLLNKRPEERYAEPKDLAAALERVKVPDRPAPRKSRPVVFVEPEAEFEVVSDGPATAVAEATPPGDASSHTHAAITAGFEEAFTADVWKPTPRAERSASHAPYRRKKKKGGWGGWLTAGLLLHLGGVVVLVLLLTGQGVLLRNWLTGGKGTEPADVPRNVPAVKARDPKQRPVAPKDDVTPPGKAEVPATVPPPDKPPPTPRPVDPPPPEVVPPEVVPPKPADPPPPKPTPQPSLPAWVSDGKAGGMSAVAFAPDGKAVAAVGDDRAVRVFDGTTGQERNSYPRMAFLNSSVRFLGKADRLIAAEGVWQWKPRDQFGGTPSVSKFSEHTGAVVTVAAAPDGRRLLTGGTDGLICLWEFAVTLDLKQTLRGHHTAVRGVDYHPRLKQAASVGDDRTLRLWDLEKGKELKRFDNVGTLVKGVRYHPSGDGLLLVTSSEMAVLDPDTGKPRVKFKLPFNPSLSAARWTPDGANVVTNGPGCVIVWDATTGEEVTRLTGATGAIAGVDVSADGKRVAACGRNLWVWELTGR